LIVNDFLLPRSSGIVVRPSGPSLEAKEVECVLHLAAIGLVEWHWAEIDAVANGLLEHGELKEAEVADLCAAVAPKKGA
jgi:hypothetical protein